MHTTREFLWPDIISWDIPEVKPWLGVPTSKLWRTCKLVCVTPQRTHQRRVKFTCVLYIGLLPSLISQHSCNRKYVLCDAILVGMFQIIDKVVDVMLEIRIKKYCKIIVCVYLFAIHHLLSHDLYTSSKHPFPLMFLFTFNSPSYFIFLYCSHFKSLYKKKNIYTYMLSCTIAYKSKLWSSLIYIMP